MARYSISVKRRDASSDGYEQNPWVASAYKYGGLLAQQYGSYPGLALQKVWRFIEEDRERETVAVEVQE